MHKTRDFCPRDPTFWLNRRVLVTGHTGFLGSWIAYQLSELGADLTGFARRPPDGSSLFGRAGLERRLTSRSGDIRDRARVEQTMTAIAPEIVIHLAGRRAAAGGLERPLDSFDSNATGTLNLLHAARGNPALRAILIVTTDRSALQRPAATGGGVEPMTASFACAAIIAATFRQCYLEPADGIGLATLHLPELVGGGDFAADRLVPFLHRAMAAGQVPSLDAAWASHPLCHVLDALDGCLALTQALVRRPRAFARAWALRPASSPAWSRAALADHLADRLGGSWRPGGWPSRRGVAGLQLAASGLQASAAARGTGIADPAPAAEVPLPALGALPPGLAGAPIAEALAWRPRLDVATALDWALEGYRRLETEADGGFLADQCGRFRLLDRAAEHRDASAPRLPTPPAKARHVSAPA